MGSAASALTGSKPNQTAPATAPRTNYNSKMEAMEQGLGSSPSPPRNNTRRNNSLAGLMEKGQSPHYGYPITGTSTPQNPSYSGGRRKRSKKSRSKKSRSKKTRKN